MEEPEKIHTIHIRKVPDELYEKMWALRRLLNVGSWKEMMEKIIEILYEEEVKDKWL